MKGTALKRPKIICHMVSSIDGRLLVDRWSAPASGVKAGTLLQHYEEIGEKFPAEGWIVGRRTMQEIVEGVTRNAKAAGVHWRETYVGNRKGRHIAVAIDPHGKLHYGKDHVGEDHIVAVLGEQVSDGYLAELRQDGVSYLFAGSDGHDLHRAMEILGATFNIETLLLEGGGRINGAFLKAGLIDEISLLVYPGIDGLSGVPSIFDFAGTKDEKPATGQSLRHTATETLEGGVVWIRYKVEKKTKTKRKTRSA